MIYSNDDIGFSFELPEGWSKDEHNLTLTFYGPNGGFGKVSEVIQLKIGSILPEFVSADKREGFLAEPGAQVIRGKLGTETNVVVLKRATNSEVSAVRDGIHYTISHSNDPVTFNAINRLCQSAHFPPPHRASDAIERWSDPAKRATAKALPAKTQSSSSDWERQGHVMASTPHKRLLEKLDGGGLDSGEAENALVALGDESLDDLLQSVAEINGRMNGSIRDEFLDPPAEMARLERRIRVMERLRSPMTLKALFDAVADSALAMESCSQMRDIAYERGELGIPMMAEQHIRSAKSLNEAAIKALVAFGKQVVPHARRYMSTSPPAVSRAMRNVISRLEPKWWRFWT